MEREIKLFLGHILGQVYRLQKHIDPKLVDVSDADLYGLLKGIESVSDELLESLVGYESRKVDAVVEVLTAWQNDPEKHAAFKGYYDIQKDLADRGVDRMAAIVILRYLRASNRFEDLIARMDSTDSPGELRDTTLSPEEL